MIFIGAELSDPNAHFVTNIIDSVGTDNDLIIDLLDINDTAQIFYKISEHLKKNNEKYIIHNAFENERFFFDVKASFPSLSLITIFSDDEWRHSNYDRYLALYSDAFTIAVKSNISRYHDYGLSPFYMRWACNPNNFYPIENLNQDIDVSFIGAAYGSRIDYIKFLIMNNVNVRVYGRGWDQIKAIRPYWGGYVSMSEMLSVISRTKINLNFLWTSDDDTHCTVKGRTLELAACKGFQLTNHTEEFSNYNFIDGINISTYRNKEEMLEKINFFLNQKSLRTRISNNSYELVMKNHTWRQNFDLLFKRLDENNVYEKTGLNLHVIVVMRNSQITHNIAVNKRKNLTITLLYEYEFSIEAVGHDTDGIMFLNNNSTINSETLYMMAAGLYWDKSDIILSNFYAGNQKNWIRFRDSRVNDLCKLLSTLPKECMMFSSSYLRNKEINPSLFLCSDDISYIEYPSFILKLSYLKNRVLRLRFAYHRNSREMLLHYITTMRVDKAISLLADKLYQKWLGI